jgi:hypothetical protein
VRRRHLAQGAAPIAATSTYLCVSNGENVKWGGSDGSLCDPGHDLKVQVVVVK